MCTEYYRHGLQICLLTLTSWDVFYFFVFLDPSVCSRNALAKSAGLLLVSSETFLLPTYRTLDVTFGT